MCRGPYEVPRAQSWKIEVQVRSAVVQHSHNFVLQFNFVSDREHPTMYILALRVRMDIRVLEEIETRDSKAR